MRDSLTLGQRVAIHRRLRGLTQVGLAQLLHRSTSWVTKVERGERRVDSMSVLIELSRALRMPLDELIGRGHDKDATKSASIRADPLRRILDRSNSLMASAGDLEPLPTARLVAEAVRLRRLYNQSRAFGAEVPVLAALIGYARRAATIDDQQQEASGALANLYRLGSLHLRQIGDTNRARLAIDRALLIAENSGDDLLLGSVAASMTVQLMIQGDPEDAVGLALDASVLTDRSHHGDRRALLAVGGALRLYAAQAAARAGDSSEAIRLLRAAEDLADQLGADREHYCLIFGPTNVAIQTVGIMVDLERPGEALRLAGPIRPRTLGSSSRAGYHYLHVARAYGMTHDEDAALRALTDAHRVAPDLVVHDALARDLVRSILRRRRLFNEPLRRLAHHMNMPG